LRTAGSVYDDTVSVGFYPREAAAAKAFRSAVRFWKPFGSNAAKVVADFETALIVAHVFPRIEQIQFF
jgi:hypothetical protein